MTSKKKKALAALLAAPTVQAAAKEAGVPYSTIRRWLSQDSAFKEAYNAELQSVIEGAVAQARQGIAEAVSTLRQIMSDPEAAQNVKVSAARTILESGSRLIELQEIETRISALETLMEDKET